MELVVEVDETGEPGGGDGNGTQGNVEVIEGLAFHALLIGREDVFFGVGDDVDEVEKLGALNGGGVADGATLDVEAMFEGVEVAGLSAPFFLG